MEQLEMEKLVMKSSEMETPGMERSDTVGLKVLRYFRVKLGTKGPVPVNRTVVGTSCTWPQPRAGGRAGTRAVPAWHGVCLQGDSRQRCPSAQGSRLPLKSPQHMCKSIFICIYIYLNIYNYMLLYLNTRMSVIYKNTYAYTRSIFSFSPTGAFELLAAVTRHELHIYRRSDGAPLSPL